MNSIFFRIYISVLSTAVVIAFIAYFALNLINKNRFDNYLVENISGIFELMSDGIARQHGADRQLWLEAVERLLQMELKITNNPPVAKFKRFGIGNGEIYIGSSVTNKNADIAIRLPENTGNYLLANVSNVNQTLGRATVLLVLNELGRFPKEEREERLAEIDRKFSYQIQTLDKEVVESRLNSSQWRQVARGDIVTQVLNTAADGTYMEVYARFGNSGKYLVLGPLNIFQWYPVTVVLPLCVLSGVLLLLSGYIMVRALEKKLQVLEGGIRKAGTEKAEPIQLTGSDAISRMGQSVNAMVDRIDALVGQQRQLLSDISHELRTPIARLMFRLESLADDKLPNDSPELLDMMRDLHSVNNMLDDILKSASLEHRQTLNAEVVELESFMNLVVDDCNLQNKEIVITRNWQKKAPLVVFDPELIRRAIENLLSNANRYCRSKIVVSTFILENSGNKELYIVVEDDGLGIPVTERERVFTPFVRVDQSRTRGSGGFGLGLAIVYKIVQLHQGWVTVERSKRLGGAYFQICLPLETDATLAID